MKAILALFILIISSVLLSAQEDSETSMLIAGERKAAESRLGFLSSSNTDNYDVNYYRLKFTVNPAVKYISGSVTVRFKALESMNSIVFDLYHTMTVDSVRHANTWTSFTLNGNDELTIDLQSTLSAGQTDSVRIYYQGDPTSSGFGSFAQQMHNGTPVIWTLSEPYGARDWWPCKQSLTDKADSIDVYITAPKKYSAVSNGALRSQIINDTLKTTHWQHRYPIPAYLIAIAVTNYAKFTYMAGSGPNTFPIINYVYPEDSATAYTQIAQTVPIMDFYESTFETYPFYKEKYGHCQMGWGGGMEHTTISFMGSFGRQLIAHELGHQWFGDKITCGSWRDIWLNEGFATYLAALVIEDFDGQTAFKNWRSSMVSSITSSTSGSVYVPASDTLNINRVFNTRLTYNKGSMVLHMLRKKLGDSNFFSGMQSYLDDPDLAYGFAKTPDFQAHMESASGLDLSEFFQDWIYGQGYPSYQISWNQDNNQDVHLTCHQTQSHSSVTYFEAPVKLSFVGNSQSMDVVFDNEYQGQSFTQNVPFTVNQIIIDPEMDLISKNNQVILPVSFIHFEGQCVDHKIHLSWTTAAERNNSAFIIQRSSDGLNWISVDTIQGKNNSDTRTSYQFTDEQLSTHSFPDFFYYRLQQLDIDGTAQFSKLILVPACLNSSAQKMQISPNPGTGEFLLTGLSPASQLILINASGKIIATYRVSAETMALHLSDNPAGVYFLTNTCASGSSAIKFILEK